MSGGKEQKTLSDKYLEALLLWPKALLALPTDVVRFVRNERES